MKERPILFSGPMVRALLDGSKTQTRRIVTPPPPAETESVMVFHHPDPRPHFYANDGTQLLEWSQACRYGTAGDRLYVRETWQHSNHPMGPYDPKCMVFYRADYLDDLHGPDGEKSAEGKYRDWRPSIHMPRAASRITLEIIEVRVERLQAISEADARAEGCSQIGIETGQILESGAPVEIGSYIAAYAELWDDLNAARGYGWDANPWVWVISFKRIEQ